MLTPPPRHRFLFEDPKTLGSRNAAFAAPPPPGPFFLPITFTVLRLVDEPLLVTWSIIATPIGNTALLITWTVRQPLDPPLLVQWILLGGDTGWVVEQPSGTPAPIETAFSNDIQQPTAESDAP